MVAESIEKRKRDIVQDDFNRVGMVTAPGKKLTLSGIHFEIEGRESHQLGL